MATKLWNGSLTAICIPAEGLAVALHNASVCIDRMNPFVSRNKIRRVFGWTLAISKM